MVWRWPSSPHAPLTDTGCRVTGVDMPFYLQICKLNTTYSSHLQIDLTITKLLYLHSPHDRRPSCIHNSYKLLSNLVLSNLDSLEWILSCLPSARLNNIILAKHPSLAIHSSLFCHSSLSLAIHSSFTGYSSLSHWSFFPLAIAIPLTLAIHLSLLPSLTAAWRACGLSWRNWTVASRPIGASQHGGMGRSWCWEWPPPFPLMSSSLRLMLTSCAARNTRN